MQDWSDSCGQLGFILSPEPSGRPSEPHFFVMVNGSRTEQNTFTVPEIPGLPGDRSWLQIIDTAADSPADFVDAGVAGQVRPGSGLTVEPMALVLLQSTIVDIPGDPS